MIFEIYSSLKLSQIAADFSRHYPYLKIEFFKKSHQWHEFTPVHNRVEQALTVSDISSHSAVVEIEIHFWNKVGTVEQIFKNKAGINIQIFRKYKDSWIQTVGTDDLTLEEQNDIGRRDSEHVNYLNNIEIEKRV